MDLGRGRSPGRARCEGRTAVADQVRPDGLSSTPQGRTASGQEPAQPPVARSTRLVLHRLRDVLEREVIRGGQIRNRRAPPAGIGGAARALSDNDSIALLQERLGAVVDLAELPDLSDAHLGAAVNLPATTAAGAGV